jgi:hypothetical protein
MTPLGEEVAMARRHPNGTALDPPAIDGSGWIEFRLPDTAGERDHSVRASIQNVHRQAYTDLALLGRFRWAGYASVQSKLVIAAEALQHGARRRAEELVHEAQATYREQLAAQRKVWYLTGVAIGIGLLAALQLALHSSIDSLGGIITEQFALQIVVFAGMGTLASVLTRLSQFRIDVYATRTLVVISGASRPLVAAFVAFATYTIFRSNLEPITVNGTDLADVDNAAYIYLTAAFLCGFSERFGKDVIDRAATALGGGSPAAAGRAPALGGA